MIRCVGTNPSIDVLYEVDALVAGSIHRPSLVTRTPGGKSLNVARALHALGERCEAVLLLGGHAGAWVQSELGARGLSNTTVIEGSGETRSCVSVVDHATGDLTEFYEPGPAYDEKSWRALLDSLSTRSRPGDWVCVSGSHPAGTPPSAVCDLLTAARSSGAAVALDFSEPWLSAALATRPDLVKVNEHEARAALGASTELPPQRAAEELGRLTRGSVIVTSGSTGAVLRAHEGDWWVARPPRTGSYPVGSGDALLAGVLAARVQQLSWPEALRHGTAAAAVNALTPGAGDLQGEDVVRLGPAIDVSAIPSPTEGRGG